IELVEFYLEPGWNTWNTFLDEYGKVLLEYGANFTYVLGKGLASLTFNEDYKVSRIRRKEPGVTATTHIAIEGKNVVMGFVDGVTGVVTKPIRGAKHGGATGFFKGLGQGAVGLVARPTGGVVDFASTSLDLIKR
ncbi:unnamed protein product, partial [Rotaria sp. Silwood2]